MKNISIILIIVFLWGCSGDENGPIPPEPSSDVIWPLAIGNIWIYNRLDSNNNLIGEDSWSFVSDTIIIGEKWFFSWEKGSSLFRNKSDGTWMYHKSSGRQALFLKYPCQKNDSYDTLFDYVIKIESIDTNITVPAGEFKCIVYNSYKYSQLMSKSFFSPNIGRIKLITYYNDGTIEQIEELKNYILK